MLEIRNLTKIYDEVIIDNLSVTFPGTGMVIIVGESGCGKTTLLNIIGGIDYEYSGDIYLDNRNIHSISHYCRKHIGFIFQNFNLINWLNIQENYLLPRFFTKIIFKRAIDDQVEKLELKKFRRKKVKVLSGGQKQRVALLRAMIKNVDILLCDEPSGSLDNENAKIVFELLKQEAKERLVIVITHDDVLARQYADCLYQMKDGKLIKQNNEIKHESFYPRLKQSRLPFSMIKLAFYQYKANLSRNIKMTFGIVLAILSIMITFTLSGSLKQQVLKQVANIFPDQMVSFQKINHQAISYDELLALKEFDNNIYLYGEPVNYEFIGISLNQDYDIEKTIYISDMTKKINENELEYGRFSSNSNEIVLSKTTAMHLSPDFSNLIGKQLYGFYLSNDEIKSILLKIVGISDEVTIFDTMYIEELANYQHISEIFEIDKSQIATQLAMMTLKYQKDVSSDINKLKEDYSNLDVKIAGDDISNRVNSLLEQVQKVLLLFSALAIVAATFLIGEVLYLSVVEKTKDIGIFKCIGASKGQILLLVLLESFIIVTISFILASCLFIQTVNILNELIMKALQLKDNFIIIDYWLIILIYIIAVCLGISSSLLPAVIASHLNPVKALKYQSY